MNVLLVCCAFLTLFLLACEGANNPNFLVKRGAALGTAVRKVCDPRHRVDCNDGGSSGGYRSNSRLSRSSSGGSNRSWSDSDHETSSGSEDLEVSRRPPGASHRRNRWEKGQSVKAHDGTHLRDITLTKPIKDSNTPHDLQKWSGM
ncbi:uncharacterized protein FA14DRAFT_153921 [Meira miltonrushii]|uniref:Secreted protein n=1 Tax=Meira miltonrushii TaxID=1280837 RepID=A0A316VLY6_9BASI|nr:uncharacterized protein FA14DRAFT_153921 [Meira miltonrushii]PWN38602.1 hypothetical protein FA14DRAFT_153921 [Meira miltonrushii]